MDLNKFFTRVLLNEPLSVARVVWFIIERTRQGCPAVRTSYDLLQRELNLSRSAVRDGLQRATAHGYLIRLKESVYQLALPLPESSEVSMFSPTSPKQA